MVNMTRARATSTKSGITKAPAKHCACIFGNKGEIINKKASRGFAAPRWVPFHDALLVSRGCIFWEDKKG